MSFGAKEPEEDTSAEDEKNRIEQQRLERLKNANYMKNTTTSSKASRNAQASVFKAKLGD